MNEPVTKDYLRRLRRSNGFTQKEFAELLGVKDRSELSRIERGQRLLKPEQLLRLYVLFNTPMPLLVPKIWMRATNGLWEGIQMVLDTCGLRKDSGSREKCSFLKSAQQRVETLDSN